MVNRMAGSMDSKARLLVAGLLFIALAAAEDDDEVAEVVVVGTSDVNFTNLAMSFEDYCSMFPVPICDVLSSDAPPRIR